ncbi:MAG: hypothetical protein AAGF11_39580 [Myxococcota bacterium]
MNTHQRRWILSSGALALLWTTGCADPCVDDGLAQDPEACLDMAAGSTTDDASDESAGDDEPGASGADETGAGDGDGDGSSGEPETLWCLDADGDGFGDPDDCIPSDEPIDGRVPNDDDCDDSSATTYPGAAYNELDDSDACRRDDDGDGWGDADPPGDPGSGIVPGADCHDSNGTLNPGKMALAAFLPYKVGYDDAPRTIVTLSSPLVDPASPPMLEELLRLQSPQVEDSEIEVPLVDIVTSTISPDGTIIGNDAQSERLYSINYDATECADTPTATATPAPQSYHDGNKDDRNLLCGIEFGPDGNLYGINYLSQLVRLDPETGEIIDGYTKALSVEIRSCGMAFDCRNNRLLFANGDDQSIYAIPADALAPEADDTIDPTLIATLLPGDETDWEPTGLAYDPVTQRTWVSSGTHLYRVASNDDNPEIEDFGAFPDGTQVSNLQYLPICE